MKTLLKKELELLAEKFHAQFECDRRKQTTNWRRVQMVL